MELAPPTPPHLGLNHDGEFLRRHRTDAGISIRELARQASLTKPITHSYISQMERGVKPIPQATMRRLLIALAELDRGESAA